MYDITTLDDKTKVYECVDFMGRDSDFITLYLKDFKRENIKTSTVLSIKQYFKK